jgi:hypothetical protein
VDPDRGDGAHRRGEPVAEAHVAVEALDGTRLHAVVTGETGHFTAHGLQPGRYRLRARAVGRPEAVAEIEVPSATGGYDVTVGS